MYNILFIGKASVFVTPCYLIHIIEQDQSRDCPIYSVIRNIGKLYKIIAVLFMKQETLIIFHSIPLIILAQGASLLRVLCKIW
jgi:hypothetical protein